MPTFTVFDNPYAEHVPELRQVGRSLITRARLKGLHIYPELTCRLIVVRRGEQKLKIRGRWYSMVGGDLLILPPHYAASTEGHPTTRIEGYDLFILLHHARPFMGNAQLEPVRESFLNLPVCHAKASDRVRYLAESLYEQVMQPQSNALAVPKMLTQFGEILLAVLDCVGQAEPQASSAFVDQAIAYMNEHIGQLLNIDDLTELTGYSKTALIEGFKAQKGVPPIDYFLRMKVRNACHLLTSTDIPIADIASELGYVSPQYFATTFKRYMSMTPSAYRKTGMAPT